MPVWLSQGVAFDPVRQRDARRHRQAAIHKWPFVIEHLDDRRIVRRTIIKRCIYGVDKNPMAVELAKVALWLPTFTVGAPLTFLDHHLRRGNSLFGFWVREAMDRLTRWGGQLLINEPMQRAMAQALAMQKLESVNDIDIAEVHQSKTLFDGIEQEARPLNSFIKILYALDWLKVSKDDQPAVRSWLDGQYGDPFEIARGRFTLGPKDTGDGHPQAKDVLGQLSNGARVAAERFASILTAARDLIRAERFQNWQVAFPGVWTHWEGAELQGGFHAVVGNPPYVRQELIKTYKPYLERGYLPRRRPRCRTARSIGGRIRFPISCRCSGRTATSASTSPTRLAMSVRSG